MSGDLGEPLLGLTKQAQTKLRRAGIEHFFHLAAIYDMTAGEEANRLANVEGTHNAIELANAVKAGCLHHVSSIAIAGRYRALFREDLFYRLQGLVLTLPPLRERKDKAAVIRHIFAQECAATPAVSMGEDMVDALKAYSWPGNMRQLRNVLRGMIAMRSSDQLDAGCLPAEYGAGEVRTEDTLSPEAQSLNPLERAERSAASARTAGRRSTWCRPRPWPTARSRTSAGRRWRATTAPAACCATAMASCRRIFGLLTVEPSIRPGTRALRTPAAVQRRVARAVLAHPPGPRGTPPPAAAPTTRRLRHPPPPPGRGGPAQGGAREERTVAPAGATPDAAARRRRRPRAAGLAVGRPRRPHAALGAHDRGCGRALPGVEEPRHAVAPGVRSLRRAVEGDP